MVNRTANQQKPKKQLTKRSHKEPPAEQTLLDHIHELRKRLFGVVLVLTVGAAAGFQMKDQLISIVMAPLHGEKLIYLTPGGGFSFILTLSIYFGALFTIPFATYHIFRFIQPIIGKTSQKLIVVVLLASILLAVGGALFGYFVTIPAALNFLTTFAGDTVTPSLTAESYLNFVVSYVLGLALLFQLPLLLFMIDHVRPLPPGMLASTQRFVIIGATIVAAVITPTPDAFNMALVAVPIVGIYEMGALTVFVRHRATQKLTDKKRNKTPVVETFATDDEPLTAIIEELQASSDTEDELDVSDAVLAVSTMAPAAAETAITPVLPPTGGTRRSIDGMTRVKPTVTVPPRHATVRIASGRDVTQRPLRSIEGIL